MTHPLAAGWNQPNRKDILIDNKSALMKEEIFKQLFEYSYSLPSAVYPGKMFKKKRDGKWFLVWFSEHKDPKKCSINNREIIFA